MLLAALAMLPKWTWTYGPVMASPPKGPVIAIVAAIGVISLIWGLKRHISDQVTTGVMFLLMAGIVWKFLPEELPLRYYSLLFVVVFLGGHALLNWQVKRGGGSPEVASDFIVYGVIGVLVGARLGHVIFYDIEHAVRDPLWVLKIWTGGLASHGAVIGLIIAMYLFTKRRGVPFLEGADRFAFAATLGATVVRIGNFLNSEIVGRVVPGQTWGIKFPRNDIQGSIDRITPFTAEELAKVPYRYPSQLFEIALGIFVFLGLLIADKAMGKEKRPRGALISWFFVLYMGGRIFTERYKEFEAIDPSGGITMGQWLSIPGLLLGLYGLYRAYKRREPAGWVEAGSESHEDDDGEEDEDEDEDEEAKAPVKAKAKPSAKAASKAPAKVEAADDDEGDDDEGDDDEGDDDEGDDDEGDDDEDDDAKKPSGDPDVDDEFEGGQLKKRKGQDGEP